MTNLYGFISNDLHKVARRLETILGVSFALHESSFRGGDYYRFGSVKEGEEFILQRNEDLEDELAEPEFEEYPLLLYVSSIKPNRLERLTNVKNLILSKMEGEVFFLRHLE